MNLEVVRTEQGWQFDAGNHLMTASCHHQRNGACGGCYARAIETLSRISEDDGNQLATALLNHLKTEKK